jgi:hypothetical protein
VSFKKGELGGISQPNICLASLAFEAGCRLEPLAWLDQRVTAVRTIEGQVYIAQPIGQRHLSFHSRQRASTRDAANQAPYGLVEAFPMPPNLGQALRLFLTAASRERAKSGRRRAASKNTRPSSSVIAPTGPRADFDGVS